MRAAGRRRHRARDRGGARDGHVPRDQLPAGPARHPRRARARCRRGRREDRGQQRRAPLERARATSRSASAQARRAWLTKEQVLNTRPWPQIAQAAKRDVPRGRRRGARVGRALSRARRRAARSWRRSSRARSARGCPRRRPTAASRSRTSCAISTRSSCPAITHWQSPRFFAYFAISASEPAILAELLAATLNQVAILWRTSPALDGARGARRSTGSRSCSACRPAGTATSRTPRRRRRSPRSRRRARRPAARRRVLGARALVGRQGGADPRARARARCRSTTSSACGPTRSTSTDACARRRDRRDDVDGVGRPRAGARRRVRGGGRLAARRRRLRGLGDGLPGAALVVQAGVERADSLVVNAHKWLFAPMDCSLLWTRRPEVLPRRRSASSPSTSGRATRRTSLRTTGRRSAAASASLKLWAVLRCYGREGLQERIREHVQLAARSRAGSRRAGMGGLRARAVLARLLPPGGLRRGERGAARARQRDRRALPLAHAPERPLRAAARDRQRADEPGRCTACLDSASACSRKVA